MPMVWFLRLLCIFVLIIFRWRKWAAQSLTANLSSREVGRAMRRFSVCSILGMAFFLGLSGCANNGGYSPPPCTVASCEIVINQDMNNSACVAFGGFPTDLYRAFNNSSRPIIAVFQKTIAHIDQSIATDTQSFTIGVPVANPGEAHGIADLGCKYLPIPNLTHDMWDEQSFALVSACFEGDPGCPKNPAAVVLIPATPQAPSKSCVSKCNAPECIRQSIPPGDPLVRDVRKGISDVISASSTISVTGVLPLACPNRTDITVKASKFYESGDSCERYFHLDPASTERVLASLPGVISGDLQRSPGQAELSFPNRVNAPDLFWFTLNDQPIGHEYISDLVVTGHTLKFIGDRAHCIWIEVPEIKRAKNGSRTGKGRSMY
jgi:hypothetical protein